MPKKPKKFGVKVWACCDAATSYCLKFQIYTEASDRGTEHGLSHRVVFELMESFLDKAYHLYIDNFYSGLNLIKSLMDRQTYACGTIRINRGEFPKHFKEAKLVQSYHDVATECFVQNVGRPIVEPEDLQKLMSWMLPD
jgi:hypothetical protein